MYNIYIYWVQLIRLCLFVGQTWKRVCIFFFYHAVPFSFCQLYFGFKMYKCSAHLWRLSAWTKHVRIRNFCWSQSLFSAIIPKPMEKYYSDANFLVGLKKKIHVHCRALFTQELLHESGNKVNLEHFVFTKHVKSESCCRHQRVNYC